MSIRAFFGQSNLRDVHLGEGQNQKFKTQSLNHLVTKRLSDNMPSVYVSAKTKARLESIQKGIPKKGKFLESESIDSVISRLLDDAEVPKEISK